MTDKTRFKVVVSGPDFVDEKNSYETYAHAHRAVLALKQMADSRNGKVSTADDRDAESIDTDYIFILYPEKLAEATSFTIREI